MEDLKTPIMTTKYHSSYDCGLLVSVRAGVFFVTRMDGVVDIWDYFYRQNELAYSHKVQDANLSLSLCRQCRAAASWLPWVT